MAMNTNAYFRTPGSGESKYNREEFDERCIIIAFDVNSKLKAQCLAYDFVFDEKNEPLVIEISYGFSPEGYDDCPGYLAKDLNWFEGRFNPYGWMVELALS